MVRLPSIIPHCRRSSLAPETRPHKKEERAALNKLNLSARAYHRVLKLARTIADLAGSDAIQAAHSDETIRQCLFAGAQESLWSLERVLPESAEAEPPAVRRHLE